MDDVRGPKHHINPPAQRDYPKVAAAVSPSPPARARRDEADGGGEDTLVTELGRARLVHLQEMEWREEESTGAGDEGETSGQLGPLENG